MTEPSRDEELTERLDELESTLRELREEIRSPPSGPLGLPRPPTPREMARFTERFAIPTAIAVLEANIRALELFREALRLSDPALAAREESSAARDRAEALGRTTLDRLDRALDDLLADLDEGTLPTDATARDIVEDARRLRDEVDERIAASEDRDGGRGDDGNRVQGEPKRDHARTAAEGPAVSETAVEIDVEDELRSIKDEVAGESGVDGNGEKSTADAHVDDESGADADGGPVADEGEGTDSGEDGTGGDEQSAADEGN